MDIRLNAMQESLASLAIEEQGLKELARQNEVDSKKLAMAIQDVEYLNRELEQVKSLQEAYLEKIRQLELRPKDSQRSLKELNLPTSGYLYGPKLPPYLMGGGALGFLVLAGWRCFLIWLTRASEAQKISLRKSAHLSWATSPQWNLINLSNVPTNWWIVLFAQFIIVAAG